MNKKQFLEFCNNRIVFLDGATGSNLMKAGMPAGVCPEKWILEHRQVMIDLQKAYVEAGSDIVYAPTFTGNRIKLADYGLSDEIVGINTKLVELSKEATMGKALVAGDITMTGRQLKPIGDLDFEEGGTPVQTNRMMLGFDAVQMDAYGRSLMGLAPEEVPYIELAEQYGAGKTEWS